MPFALRLVAAVASGALLLVASPPTSFHWVLWVMWVPLLWALRSDTPRHNALLGYVGGVSALMSAFYWLVETVTVFSNLPWVAAVAILLAFGLVWGAPFMLVFGTVHALRRRFGLGWVFLAPAVLVGIEKLVPQLFPFAQGAVFYRTGPLWQVASVFGVTSLSYLAFLANTATAEVLYRVREGGRPTPVPHLVWAGLLGVTLLFGSWRVGAVDAHLANAPTVRVALLQQNITMNERLRAPPRRVVQDWMEVTRDVLDDSPDIVIWPEGSFPANPAAATSKKLLSEVARSGGFDLLVGGGTVEPNPPGSAQSYTAYNSCYHFDPSGEIGGRYDKMVPLPFGEYMPFADVLPILKQIEGPGNFQAGKSPTLFKARTFTFTTPICYEAILDRAMWKLKDADVFVNITNDAWFGDTAAPHQHAMLSAVQVIHYGQPMIRVAYTGVSFLVEPHGRILGETEPFVRSAEVETLRVAGVTTAFESGGWLFPYLCAAVGATALVASRRRRASPVTPTPPTS